MFQSSLTSLKSQMLEAFRKRMYFFGALALFFFLVLIIQLVNLQLIHGTEYRMKSRLNMENYIPIPASRGDIYDRNFEPGEKNVVVVSNRPSFNITMVPAKFKSQTKFRAVLENVSLLLGVESEEIIKEMKDRNPWERLILKEDVSFDTVVKIASHQDQFPNIDWEDAPVRVYNFSDMFAHVVGYIGVISKKEYKKLKIEGYKHYQKVGKSGIERQYDRLLRGRDGFVRRIVDVKQRTEGEEVGLKPIAGYNMVLSIDYHVQKTAHDAMTDKMGSVIVMKPSTGEVIALLSKPDFDPNLIISKNNKEIIKELQTDKNRPFLNRVIQSKYPPASTFKLITAIAGLETEKTHADKHYYCPGKYTLRGYRDHDFYCYGVHGSNDLYRAIAKSCSVYFYQLAHRIGPTDILTYADHFGLDNKTGIDIPGEVSGFIPSKRWKYKTFGQPWFDGDTINLSIGQGFILVTPIGLCNFAAAVVNNGIVYRPYLVKEIYSNDNSRVIKRVKKEKMREIPLSPLTLLTIKKGMRMSVTEGTSGRLAYLKVPAAGKTGTAQTRSIRQEKFSQHAWFVGYMPYDGPPDQAIVTVVMVEYGVAGAASAVPVAEQIFKTLIERGYFGTDPNVLPATMELSKTRNNPE
jgi:penicillin-binding protein 2